MHQKETAVNNAKDIIVVVDYHAENLEVRTLNCATGEERRQTAIKNWISSLLHHETWADRTGLWSEKGLQRLVKMDWPASDRFVLDLKLEQLRQIEPMIQRVEQQMKQVYDTWPEA